VDESRDEQRRHLDLPGTALVTSGLFALVYALIDAGSAGWTSPRTIGLIAAAAVLLALFVAREQRTAEPMVPLGFFRRRAFGTSTVVMSLVGFAFVGVLYLIVLYFQNVQGYSPLEAGMRTLPLTLTQAAVAAGAGRLNARVGPRGRLTAGMLLLSVGLLGLAQLHAATPYDRIWPFQLLLGLGMGLATPALTAAAMATVERDQSGIASGVINAARQVGAALGIATLGALAAALTRSDWHQRLALLPAATQAKAAQLTSLAVGGQGKAVAAVAGQPAGLAALESFVHGLRGALLASSVLALVGAGAAFIGLRRSPQRLHELESTEAARPARAA
jgi:DHA2 family methylenomycin A resistance protein-like MFS transporter